MRRTAPPAPVRMIHLGLGNFFRAHQAWYTDAAGEWGIAAFSGRSAATAEALTAQDGLYTLVTRGPAEDRADVVGSITEAYAGTDAEAWLRSWRRPEIAVVTLTVTEAAYRDVVPERLLAGLTARRAAGGGPLAIVSCDNLPANGSVTASAVLGQAAPDIRGWIEDNVTFPTTMVDRITPATTPEDVRGIAALTGYDDPVPVVTEPYTEWVISGAFPAGRPAWEKAGALFADDVEPYERRKLWLLNGGHSLLAYVGSLRGHATVFEALTDPECRKLLEQWWDLAAGYLDLPSADYRASLVERWSNKRIEHRLAQIAADGSQKIPIRFLPVLRLARADGKLPDVVAVVLAAWIRHLRGESVPVKDAGAAPFAAAPTPRALLALLDPDLGADAAFVAAVQSSLG